MHQWAAVTPIYCIFILSRSIKSSFEFRTFDPEGLIFYGDTKNGDDWFILSLKDGVPLIQINKGVLVSVAGTPRLNDGKWHTVSIQWSLGNQFVELQLAKELLYVAFLKLYPLMLFLIFCHTYTYILTVVDVHIKYWGQFICKLLWSSSYKENSCEHTNSTHLLLVVCLQETANQKKAGVALKGEWLKLLVWAWRELRSCSKAPYEKLWRAPWERENENVLEMSITAHLKTG